MYLLVVTHQCQNDLRNYHRLLGVTMLGRESKLGLKTEVYVINGCVGKTNIWEHRFNYHIGATKEKQKD